MKAAIYEGPGKMEIREVPVPTCGENEILLKVKACAICGTDMRIFEYGQKNVVPPQIIGHEIAGEIVKVGEKVGGYQVGERVIVVTSVGCGRCNYCRRGIHNLCVNSKAMGYYYPGGFAQYMVVPAEAVNQGNVITIPFELSYEEATLAEPLSCCINGQEYLHIQMGDTVVVIGSGPIGCMHTELAKAQGATHVILADISDTRLQLAGRFSANLLVNNSRDDLVAVVQKFTGGQGADVVIVACGVNSAQEQALQLVAPQGRISYFAGLPKDNPYIKFDSNSLHYKEISIYGAFASHASQYIKALALLSTHKVDARKIITHTFPLQDIVAAIKLARSGESLKVVIQPEEVK